jgi:hypothetical protein
LDISCLDRLYLTGFVAKLQTPGRVIYFLHDHRGNPITSPALFERIGNKFRADMTAWAQANAVPVITFKAGERKADVMAPHLQAAADAGVSKVVALGKAQEFARVWTARRRDTDPDRCPQFSFSKEQRRVSVFYVSIWDQRMGPGFIKICPYFPYPIKVWVNGHEWAKRQAVAAGIGFTELSNGFATCTDPAGLQEICDRFSPGTVQVWFERWMARIPLPLTTNDRDSGFWWDLSMRQIETSRTLVFDDDVHARAFFEALLVENMDLGRPQNVELLFRRGQRSGRPTQPPLGGFKTKIDQRCELVTLNVFYKNSRLKQYLKDGAALRIETVVNDPKDLRCNRMLTNLPELQAKARAINDRLLDTETVGQDTALVSPVIERITRPTVTDDGRKAPALRFGDLRGQALAGALASMLMAVTGITNKTLRGLDDRPAAPPLQHEPGQLRPRPPGPQRTDHPRPRTQPVRPDPRRPPVRPPLHQDLRPHPAATGRHRPPQRPTRTPGRPRPPRRRTHHRRPRPDRGLITARGPDAAPPARVTKLRTLLGVLAPKVP